MQQPDLNLPPNDLAYIAGFIDSDGSIHATRDKRGSYPSYRVTVTVTNVSQEICDWFMARFMVGRVYTLGKPRSEHHKVCYRWIVQGAADCELVLRAVLPYMKVKANRAELALALLDLRPRGKRTRPPLEVMAKKEYLFTQLKNLSRTGPRT